MSPKFEPIKYEGGILKLIDQTKLPSVCEILECRTVEELWSAIQRLSVRGAPLIGIAAAYGVCLGLKGQHYQTKDDFWKRLDYIIQYLRSSRPTAVNLAWALERMRQRVKEHETGTILEMQEVLETEAHRIFEEDLDMCRSIGAHGKALIREGDSVLTHCNAGGLATSGYGTALSVLFAAHEAGKNFHVFSGETRPLLQGSRLTAWELSRYGIPVTLICDSMAASLMRSGKIKKVIVGADRIAANGDVANKIGTYSLAVLSKHHNIPFYVAAPYSTFDFNLASGEEIPIEQRDPTEISHGFGRQTAPENVAIHNPAFDITPAELITAIITEKGILNAPVGENIQRYYGEKG